MKVTLDPSILIWNEEDLANDRYLKLASATLFHMVQLEKEPVTLVMPIGWDTVYQHFPFGNTAFHPEVMEISGIFWRFVGRHIGRIEEVTPLPEVVVLSPDVCAVNVPDEERLRLRSFFGRLADWKLTNAERDTALLAGDPELFKPHKAHLQVALVQRQTAVGLLAVFDEAGWNRIRETLDYRPEVRKCLTARVSHYARIMDGCTVRPFDLSPKLEEELCEMSIDDPDLFEEIVDAMSRWIAGIPSGRKPHKLEGSKGVWRLDVRKGCGNKIHCRFKDGSIRFSEYHDDHDEYKIN